MSALLPPDPSLVRRAAHLRARGLSWPAVADALGTSPAAVERLPLVAPDVWAEAFADGLAAAQAEAFAVCLKMLVEQMQCGDVRIARAAGELLVKLHTANLRHRGKEDRKAPVEPEHEATPEEPSSGRARLLPSQSFGSPGGSPSQDNAEPKGVPSGERPGLPRPTATAGVNPAAHQNPAAHKTPPPARGRPISFTTLRKNTLTAFLKPSG